MKTSRRRIFKISGMILGSFTLSLLEGGPLSKKSRKLASTESGAKVANLPDLNLAQLQANTFQTLQDKAFKIKTSAGTTIPVTLTGISQIHQDQKTNRFSLTFHPLRNNQRDEPLTQGTYHFSHSRLGKMNLFMVPFPNQHKGQDYVVTINHLVG